MPPLRILISRPDRIGDVVLSTPLPREIKKKYPESFIVLLLREYTSDIYLHNPYVDDVILIGNKTHAFSVLRMVQRLRDYNFTHAFMLLPHERINYSLALAGIKYRFGTGHKLFQMLTNVKSVSRNKYIPLRHESDYCLDFIRKIGIETENLSPEIYLSEEEILKADTLRKEYKGDKDYLIGINTTSGNSAPNWNTPEYIKLIKILTKEKSYQIMVTDFAPPNELRQIPDVIFPNESKKLRDSIINFASLDILVSSSTGPMHVCAALKVPTLSMFCPLNACSPRLWGPLGNKNIIVLPSEGYCRQQCPGDPKKCTLKGADGISAEKISEEVRNFIRHNE